MIFGSASFGGVAFGGVMQESGAAIDATSLAPIFVSINGVDVRVPLQVGSFRKSDTLGQPVTASFTLLNPEQAPAPGDIVLVRFYQAIEFSGTIDRVVTRTDDLAVIHYECELLDWSQILMRRQVKRNFTNMTLQGIIDSLLDIELLGESMSLGTVDSRLMIPLVDASSKSRVFDLLREMAGATGQTFYVDFQKRIQMRGSSGIPERGTASLSTTTPDFVLDESGFPIPEEGGGGFILAEEQPYDRLQILAERNVLVRGTSRTQDRERYRNVQMVVVTGTPAVQGEEPIVVSVIRQNDDQIAARQAVEGGTGRYEEVEEIKHPTSNLVDDLILLGKSYAEVRLAISGAPRTIITLQVRGYGFRAGQIGTVDLPTFGVSGDFILQRVSAQEVAGQHLFHTLELVQSNTQQRAYESWLAILGKGKISIQLFGVAVLEHGSASFTTPGFFIWIVPATVVVVTVTVIAGSGGGGGAAGQGTQAHTQGGNGGKGGASGKAISSLNVVEGQVLDLAIGGKGFGGVGNRETPFIAQDGSPGSASTVFRSGVSVAEAYPGQAGKKGALAPFGVNTPPKHGADGSIGGGSGSIVSVGGGKVGGVKGLMAIGSQDDGANGSDGSVLIEW